MARKGRSDFALAVWLTGLFSLGSGCFYTSPPRRDAPYDAVIVPGCPTENNGSLSPCQKQRAAWAAVLWQRGQAANFITSGAAVYSPYVEAEAIAAALAVLGVPKDRIYLDPHALHTDENMRNATRIAQQLGWQHVAVASHSGQAKGGCSMVTGLGQLCTPLPIEDEPTQAKLRAQEVALSHVQGRLILPFRPLAEVEAERRRKTGQRRLPSSLLYGWMWLRRVLGQGSEPDWLPAEPMQPLFVRYSDAVYSDSGR